MHMTIEAPSASHAPVSGSPSISGGGSRICATTTIVIAATIAGSQWRSTTVASGRIAPTAATSAATAERGEQQVEDLEGVPGGQHRLVPVEEQADEQDDRSKSHEHRPHFDSPRHRSPGSLTFASTVPTAQARTATGRRS